MTKNKFQQAYDNIQTCLSDDEDGQGYLFDAMKNETGATVFEALQMAGAVIKKPTELERFLETNKTKKIVSATWGGGSHPATWKKMFITVEGGDTFSIPKEDIHEMKDFADRWVK